jgi:hypothetical protein
MDSFENYKRNALRKRTIRAEYNKLAPEYGIGVVTRKTRAVVKASASPSVV